MAKGDRDKPVPGTPAPVEKSAAESSTEDDVVVEEENAVGEEPLRVRFIKSCVFRSRMRAVDTEKKPSQTVLESEDDFNHLNMRWVNRPNKKGGGYQGKKSRPGTFKRVMEDLAD